MQIKRRFNRWQIKQEAKIKLEGAVEYARCTINDISFLGAKISLPLKLPKDTFLKLKIVLQESFILNVEAWVAWQKTIDGTNVYGLYFTKINDPDKERIYHFVYEGFPEQLVSKWRQETVSEEGGEEMEDRRTFERFGARFPLRFLNLGNGKEGMAQTRDISAKGLGLATREELARRTPLEMWVDLPNGNSPLYCRGEVAWSKPADTQGYWAGVTLEKADLMGVSRVLRATEAQ